jgi:nucleoside-diphosphate-sugar epimerase/glycosyltransferase involved in cell wall biosynthesis
MTLAESHLDPLLYSDFWDSSIDAEVKALPGPILIIGASGFIGAKLFFSLAQRRRDVYAASRDPQNSWRFVRRPAFYEQRQLVQMDLTSFDSVRATLDKLRPRTVFNLSAYGAYERQQQARLIHEVNYMGTLNLILGLRETGCDALVQAGSSSEYGLNCTFPDETAELTPNSDYAASKVGAGYLLKFYGKLHNFPCTDLRLYSVYGPWEERDRLIPRVVQSGLQGQYPPLADPKTSRDFVYVDDATAAFVKAALKTSTTEPGLSLNVATGTRTTLGDVAQASKALFQIPGEPQFGSHHNRKWDLSNWYGNPGLAKAKLDWASTTEFKTGLERTADWEKRAADLIRTAPSTGSVKTLSLIVACYRDHQAIPVMYERIVKAFEVLKPRGYGYEVIFVNDCSPTSDEDEIAKICQLDAAVVGVTHSRNFGSQSAFLSGLEVSTGDAVVFMDGDLQDPPEIISQFIDAWEKGFDIVYGERIKRDAPAHMQLAYKLFYRLFRRLSDVPIPVDAGDFSLINRKAAEHLLRFSERDVFLRGLRAWVGFKQTGVPYLRPERAFGVTTNSLLKNIWWAKKAIFSFSTKPLAFIQGLGLSMFALTVLAGLFYFVYHFIQPAANASGITTVVLLVLALGGLQLFSLSILGDYLGKVLEEVKARPRFIRNRIIRGGNFIQTEDEITQYVKTAREQIVGKHR